MDTSSVREITPGAVVSPTPAWVDLQPYTIPAVANPHFIAGGLCQLLDDLQIDLCHPARATFYRRATMVTASAGAEQAAQFSVTFDPAFERVEVHNITVIRKGHRKEHAAGAFYEILRRERNLERLQFDGRLTAHVTLPDVRVGDVVETSFTRYGSRSSLQGKHSHWAPFDWTIGSVEMRVRQRAPRALKINERATGNAPAASERVEGDIIDRRWRTFERPAYRFEALTPPWTQQGALIQWSEWRDWAEVASAFTPLYEHAGELPPEFEAHLQTIAATESSAEGRAAALLRYTQNDVRYLAISIGEGGYTPRKLNDVCDTRYGDCKDKSKLFVAMARRLGLDACPALVNTRDGPALDTYLPSGQLFDHCIVRVRIGDATYWLDPTRIGQQGPLNVICQCHFGWALPLNAETTSLEKMPSPPHLNTLQINETVTLGKRPSMPATYEWRVIQRGSRAEAMRARIALEGTVGLFRMYADDVRRALPGARPVEQAIARDDTAMNEIETVERYEIEDPWATMDAERVTFTTLDLYLRSCLAKLDVGPRQNAIYLGQVGLVTRHLVIQSGVDYPASNFVHRIVTENVSYETALKHSPRKLEIVQRLDVRRWTMAADEASKYREITAELDRGDIVIPSTVRMGKFVKTGGGIAGKTMGALRTLFWVWLGIAALAAILGGLLDQ